MEVLVRDYSVKRLIRKIIFSIASGSRFLPGRYRAYLFSLGGVRFKKPLSCFVGKNVYFDDLHPEKISVGENTIITEGTRILSHFLDLNYSDYDHQYVSNVFIGDNVFIGMNTIVVQPISIGHGAVIGANSVVTKDISPYTICAGNPARFIRNREIIC